jgi:hypothetical protein
MRRPSSDTVQQISDVDRSDGGDAAAVERLAMNEQGVAQAVAGFLAFEARESAGYMGLRGLKEGQGARLAGPGGVSAPWRPWRQPLRASSRACASPMAG